METNPVDSPEMAQATTVAPAIDLTQRYPTRAGTMPNPAGHANTLLRRDTPAKRSQTLPSFPQFDPYAINDTPVVTPGSVVKLSQDYSDANLPSSESSTKQFSWRGHYVRRACIATLRFVEKHWIIVSTLFIMALVSASIAVGWSLRLGSFQGVQVLDSFLIGDPVWVKMDANLISVDSDSQSITLDWFLYYFCPDGSTPSTSACPDVDIYFDENLLRGQSQGSTANNEKPPPIFTINATDYQAYNASSRPDYRVSSPQFRTEVAMTNFYYGGRSAQSYPFDKYTCTLAFFAQSISDNSTVPIGIGTTTGIAVGFNAKLDTSISGVAAYDVSVKNLIVTRGQVIRMYAILIVIAIWMITIIFIMACIVSVFLGKGIKGDVLVLPVATLFAFTQLRGTMPGAPNGFGADIDFVGILPCLALLTFSSVFMSAIFLFRNPEDDSPRWLRWRSLSQPASAKPNTTV